MPELPPEPELMPEPEPMLELPPPERPLPSPLPEEPPPEKPLPVTWLEALNAALGCETVMNPAAISPPMRAAMAEMRPAGPAVKTPSRQGGRSRARAT
jgi:hypothetical protein